MPSGSGPPSTTRRPRDGERPRDPPPAGLVRPGLRASPSPSCTSTRRRSRDLFLGSGDRLGAVLGGLAFGGARRSLSAVGVRDAPLPPPPLPGHRALSGRAAQLDGDRVHRRGHVPGRDPRAAALARRRPTLANVIQAVAVRAGHAPRGARTRPLPARPDARDRPRRRLADGRHGGIGAAFLGHAITRFAVFLCTGHAGQTKPRGREAEEIERRRRDRRRAGASSGSRESASRDR